MRSKYGRRFESIGKIYKWKRNDERNIGTSYKNLITRYKKLEEENSFLKQIYSDIDKLEKTKLEKQNFEKKYDAFQIFAFIALALLVLEILVRYIWFRRIP